MMAGWGLGRKGGREKWKDSGDVTQVKRMDRLRYDRGGSGTREREENQGTKLLFGLEPLRDAEMQKEEGGGGLNGSSGVQLRL